MQDRTPEEDRWLSTIRGIAVRFECSRSRKTSGFAASARSVATSATTVVSRTILTILAAPTLLLAIGAPTGAAELKEVEQPLFCIGTPDNHAAEFGLAAAGEGYMAFSTKFPNDTVYIVGSSKSRDWPYIHPAPLDKWAGGRAHTFTIRFTSARDQDRPLYLVMGMAGGSPALGSKVVVTVNDVALAAQVAPSSDPRVCFRPTIAGKPDSMIFDIPSGSIRKGTNTISIRLDEQSWIIYDYVALSTRREAPELVTPPELNLLTEFRKGPMAGVDEIIFAARALGEDPHWYANFGYTLDKSRWRTYGHGGRLVRLNLKTRKVTVLLDDAKGGIRDPAVHYDGRKIVFSYRKGDSPHYHLYVINADGTGLTQLTDGPYDDIEPTWLPDGRIMFVSSRCNRCVNCHTTDVAVLHCCDADGGNIHMLSANSEHDNTPWVLPNGQVLYTRWEYVDRSQVRFHHLWTTTPDGQRQTVFYGNMHPGTTMIDAKPIPGSNRVVASFSPGHGRREHEGVLTIVDPRKGPDDKPSARAISHTSEYRDPWAFSDDAFMAAHRTEIVLMDGSGRTQTIYRLSEADVNAGLECHEPRPLCSRPSERLMPTDVDWAEATGRLLLVNVYQGRSMSDVRPGEIKKLLVLEPLPKPMNYTGGMEPISYGGTFNLERILGTVPVEPDGSAYMELPALRGLFLVALDENDMSVKRMQSFLTVVPGETTTCIGCHEQRTQSPLYQATELMALARPPHRITPIDDAPEIFDYPRDIQPILDKHCVGCHDYEATKHGGPRAGGVILTGDRGPVFSISYYTMTALDLISDGRNAEAGNRAPRTIGSSASRLMQLVDGSHYDARLSEHEQRMVRLWIESGATYPGTYAALGTGMIGAFEIVDRSIRLDRSDTEWPSMKASMEVLKRRCCSCHAEDGKMPLPLSPSHIAGPGAWGGAFKGSGPWIPLADDDVRRRFTRHLFYNLTRPEKSLILLAPLSKQAGGYEVCGEAVFSGTNETDYQTVLAAIRDAKEKLDQIKRFDMPGFRPRTEYVHEMKRYGILPTDSPDDAAIDVYATDRAYWRSHWHRAGGW